MTTEAGSCNRLWALERPIESSGQAVTRPPGLRERRRKYPRPGLAIDPLPQSLAVEDLGIALVQVLNHSAQDVTPGIQESLHGQVGQVRRGEDAAACAPFLKFTKKSAGNSESPMGNVDVNRVHEGATEESIIHDAIADKSIVLGRQQTLTLLHRCLYERRSLSGGGIDGQNTPEVGNQGISNR